VTYNTFDIWVKIKNVIAVLVCCFSPCCVNHIFTVLPFYLISRLTNLGGDDDEFLERLFLITLYQHV